MTDIVSPNGGNAIIQPGAADAPPVPTILRRKLSPADIVGLSQPLEILPAVPYHIHLVIWSAYFLNFETTPYSGDQTGLWYGTSISADNGGIGVFNGAASQVLQSMSWSIYSGQPFDGGLCVGAPLNLWSPNTSPVGGDSLGALVLCYATVRAQ